MRPDWVEIVHDPAELRLWEGAATLIEEDAEGLCRARILLGRSFFLDRSGLLAHELVHAVRCAFPETPVEEVMAWRTSPCRWLRSLSGLFLDGLQLVLVSLGVQLALLDWILDEPLFGWGSALTVGWATLRVGRALFPLWLAFRQLNTQRLPTWPILIHLSADEIAKLGRGANGFWQSFAEGSHFRFEFMQATFDMLRTK